MSSHRLPRRVSSSDNSASVDKDGPGPKLGRTGSSRMAFPVITAASKFLRSTQASNRRMSTVETSQADTASQVLMLGDIVSLCTVEGNGSDGGLLIADGMYNTSVGLLHPDDELLDNTKGEVNETVSSNKRNIEPERGFTNIADADTSANDGDRDNESSMDHSAGHHSEEEDAYGSGVFESNENLTPNRLNLHFRICPQLRYEMQRNLEKSKVGTYSEAQRAYLLARSQKEENDNSLRLQQFTKRSKSQAGSRRRILRYGDTVQLQHVKSGKFLSMAPKKVAKIRKDCLVVDLLHGGSESSWFQVLPRFKVRAEGAPIFAGDQIFLRSVKQTEYYLNKTSETVPRLLVANECLGLTEERALREVNLSIDCATWRMHLAARGANTEAPTHMYDCQAIYLYHPEIEALLGAPFDYASRQAMWYSADRDALVKPDYSVWIAENATNLMEWQQLTGSQPNPPPQRKRPNILATMRNFSFNGSSTSIGQSSTGEASERSTGSVAALAGKTATSSQNTGAIQWNSRVALRHLATGRYLSVKPGSLHADYIEEHGTLELETTTSFRGMLSSFQFIPALSKARASAGDQDDSGDSDSDSGLTGDARSQKGIRFDEMTCFLAFEPPTPLILNDGMTSRRFFLHAPPDGSVCVSLVRHDQDALVGTPATLDTVRAVESIKSWARVAMNYSNLLRTRLSSQSSLGATASRRTTETNITRAEATPMIEVILELLAFCRGETSYHSHENLNFASNEAEIDDENVRAELVDYELSVASRIFQEPLAPSQLATQVRLASMRLFEILFHVCAMPEAVLANDWIEKLRSTPFRWAYFIHRLCFRAVTAIFQNSRELELALADTQIPRPPRHFCDFFYAQRAKTNFESVLMSVSRQLSCGVGAVTMLRRLVTNNEILLDSKFKAPQIAYLVGLIRKHGPHKRFVDLLASLCTCRDLAEGVSKCIVSNQELIVLEIFRHHPEQVLLEVAYQLDETSNQEDNLNIKSETIETGYEGAGHTTWDHQKSVSGSVPRNNMTSNIASEQIRDTSQEQFAALQEQVLGGDKLLNFDKAGHHKLRQGDILITWNKGLLARTPSQLNCLVAYESEGKLWVNLEELQDTDDPDAEKLCSYLHGQLVLMTRLAEGRSYNCIQILEQVYSFEALVMGASNARLRPQIRGAFCELLGALYLDRYPHVPMNLPRRVHFRIQNLAKSENSIYGRYREMPTCLMLFNKRELRYEDGNDATYSKNFVSKVLSGNTGPFFRLCGPDKFLLPRELILKALLEYAAFIEAKGVTQPHQCDGHSALASATDEMEISDPRPRTGTEASQRSVKSISRAQSPANEQSSGRERTYSEPLTASTSQQNKISIQSEDGRALFASQLIALGEKLMVMGFHSSPEQIISLCRAAVQLLEFSVSETFRRSELVLRQRICELLISSSMFETDHSVSLVLDSFESATPETKMMAVVETVKGGFARASATKDSKWVLFDLQKQLTPKSLQSASVDKLLVDMVIHCGQQVDPSVQLFERALDLLVIEHSPGSRLMQGLSSTLIVSSSVGIRFYDAIRSRSAVLLNDLQSYEIWGVSNEFSDIGWAVVRRVKSNLRFLIKSCHRHRSIIEALNVAQVVISALEVNVEPSLHLSEIKRLALRFLVAFTENSADNQHFLFDHVALLEDLLEDNFEAVVESLSAMVRGNRKICANFPLRIVRRLVSEVTILQNDVLLLFVQLVAVNGVGIRRNQDSIIQAVFSEPVLVKSITESVTGFGVETCDSTSILLVELFSAVTRGHNPFCEAKVQSVCSLELLLDILAQTDASTLSHSFRCVLLRCLSDVYLDTGLADAGTIQQVPRLVSLFQSMLAELGPFLDRCRAGDVVTDTLSNFRTLVFHGFFYTLRSFFHHAFEFQTAPSDILSVRAPLLSVVQDLAEFAETPSEQHLARRARSGLLKSISAHRRARRTEEERRLTAKANRERRELDRERRKIERLERRLLRSQEKNRGRPTQENWTVFLRFLKANHEIRDLIIDEQRSMIQSIWDACGNIETISMFLRSLMNFVRATCREHTIRHHEVDEPLSRRSDQTAQQTLTIVQFTLEYIADLDVAWRASDTPREEIQRNAQSRLAEMGAVDVAFQIMCIQTSTKLARKAVLTLIALLEGGNRSVQLRLYTLLMSPRGERFFARLSSIFGRISEAARVEINLEKKRRLQEEALLARDDGDTASVLSGTSSIIATSIGATSLGTSSSKASSTSSSEDEDEDEDHEDDDSLIHALADDTDNTEEHQGHHTGDGEDSDDSSEGSSHHGSKAPLPLDIAALFELQAPRTRRSLRRKRTQAEIDQREESQDIVKVVRFLQLCMEGHFLEMQNLLRAQGEAAVYRTSTNVLLLGVEHACLLTKSEEVLACSREGTIRQLIVLFDFLIESMQGPCFANQELLSNPIHRVVETIKKVLLTSFTLSDTFLQEADLTKISHDDEKDAKCILELKTKAIRTMCAMLEGRKDTKVQEALMREIDLPLLQARFVEIHRAITYFEWKGHSDDTLLHHLEAATDTMMIMSTIMDIHRAKGLSSAEILKPQEATAIAYFLERIRNVEVVFKGSVHRSFYPRPKALNFLSHSARVRLMQDIDVEDPDLRLREFLESANSLLDEVSQVQQLSESLPIQNLLMDMDEIRFLAFALSVWSNFMLLFSYSADSTEICSKPLGLMSLFEAITAGPGAELALRIVQLLTLAQIAHLILLRGLDLLTQIPIRMKKLERKIRLARARLRRPRKQSSTLVPIQEDIHIPDALSKPYNSRESRLAWALAVGCSVATILLAMRFGWKVWGNSRFLLCAEMWIMSQTILYLRAVRRSGGDVGLSDSFALWYCCLFDVLTTSRSLFQFMSILACWYGLGLGSNAVYLVIPLFDVVLSNETLQNVVQAVRVPFRSLVMTFILLSITLYAFSLIAIVSFQEHFYDEETGENQCKDLLGCFMLILDIGLRVGEGPAALMIKLPVDHDQALQRLAFDLGFVIIISIFLLNAVFGVLVDQFSSLREALQNKQAQLNNACFICGLSRAEFDAISFDYKQKQDELAHYTGSKGAHAEFKGGFVYHVQHEHNIYDYLGFILYLEAKDRTECNGLESYILEELEKSSGDAISWIPSGRALALGVEGSQEGSTRAAVRQLEHYLGRSVRAIFRRLDNLEAKVNLSQEITTETFSASEP